MHLESIFQQSVQIFSFSDGNLQGVLVKLRYFTQSFLTNAFLVTGGILICLIANTNTVFYIRDFNLLLSVGYVLHMSFELRM